ncbi:MAG: hypothetical protein HQK83_07165 [Fibrobacteria bacterium]|nr:hypothetical protein [Fibrobacteria bacterium]
MIDFHKFFRVNTNGFYVVFIFVAFLFSPIQSAIPSIKVIGFNIGCYNKIQWEDSNLVKIGNGIIEEQPDLVGLTEVALNFSDSGNVSKNWVSFITHYLDSAGYPMYSYFVPTFGWECILLLSKYPILDTSNVQIDSGSNMRVGQITIQPNKDQNIHFFMTHIWSGSTRDEQKEQVNKVLSFAAQYPGLKILTGDFNFSPSNTPYPLLGADDWDDSAVDFPDQEFKTVDGCCHRPPGSTYQIDFIFAKDHYGYIESHVPYDNPNLDESDHWPIIATVRITPDSTSGIDLFPASSDKSFKVRNSGKRIYTIVPSQFWINGKIELFTVTGRKILTKRISEKKMVINLTRQKEGVFLFRVKKGELSQRGKIYCPF